jgi:phage terminase large subunit-like protein
MYCDRRFWETDIDEWAVEYGDKVVLDVSSSPARLRTMTDRWEAAVRTALQHVAAREAPDGLSHDGDPDLRRHIGNARRERFGGRAGKTGGWRPAKKSHKRKIDLYAALLLALEARGDAIERGLLKEEPVGQTSVWC